MLIGGRQNLDASSDNERTWTAGMTKGKAPAELQAQLQQFRELKRTRRLGPLMSESLFTSQLTDAASFWISKRRLKTA